MKSFGKNSPVKYGHIYNVLRVLLSFALVFSAAALVYKLGERNGSEEGYNAGRDQTIAGINKMISCGKDSGGKYIYKADEVFYRAETNQIVINCSYVRDNPFSDQPIYITNGEVIEAHEYKTPNYSNDTYYTSRLEK